MRPPFIAAALLAAASLALHAADWPAWRGVDGLGVSPEKDLPLEWSREKNMAWRVVVPGKGASSPIRVGSRIYLTSQAADNGLHVLALDANSGALVWDTEIARGKLHAHDLHNMATPTAVSDGKSVWALFGTGDYARLDLDGKVVWQRNFVKELGPIKTNHGYGTSPVLLDGRLYLTLMHQGPSWIQAVDAATGKDVWKKDREFGAEAEAKDSYSTPFVLRSGKEAQLVVAGGEVINAYTPSTGEEAWRFGGLKVNHPYGRTIAGPTGGEGVVVVVASGFQNRGFTTALRAGGKGDVTASNALWTAQKFSADCPTPVLHDGLLFSIRDDGMASCLDLKTGEPQWQERLFTDNVKVSPVLADGRVYFQSGQANCAVVKASRKFEVLARNELKESTLSTPALSGGRIYLRTDEALYCVASP
jgi:outer membrane protein assembly factor BamB